MNRNRFRQDQSGATAIEYALIAAVMAVAIGAAVYALGGDVNAFFENLIGRF